MSGINIEESGTKSGSTPRKIPLGLRSSTSMRRNLLFTYIHTPSYIHALTSQCPPRRKK
jgi:hypothetical protein